MNREDIIRMAREAGFDVDKKDGTYEVFEDDGYYIQTDRVIKFAALVAAAERDRLEPAFKQLEALMQVRETQPNKPCCLAEREACAQIADAEASIEGIAQRIAAAIRARGNA
jgi:hypothetical protein